MNPREESVVREGEASILLDLGSTAVKARAVVAGRQEAVAEQVTAMPARLDGTAASRHESDPEAVLAVIRGVLERLVAESVARGAVPVRIAVSSQMHTALISGGDGRALSPMISWQDDRLAETDPLGRSRLDALLEGVAEGDRARAGMARRPGFGAGNLAVHLAERSTPLPPDARAHTLGTFVAAHLGGPYATHRSAAATLGLLDVDSGGWVPALRRAFGLDEVGLPEVIDRYEPVGTVTVSGRELRWFPEIGDHQASVVGGGGLATGEIAISLGTAGIAARWSPTPSRSPQVDSRPYPGGGFLLAVSKLPGGRFAGQLGALAAGLAEDLSGTPHTAADLLRRAEQLVAEPENPPAVHLAESPDGHGGRVLVLRGAPASPRAASELLHALVRSFGERYREAVALLYPDGERPRRVRFNGGLAMSSPWFRDGFARELGLEVADYPASDLALAGLRRLLDEHDAAIPAPADHP